MLSQGSVCAAVAVKDLDAAKDFYGNTLGLNQVEESPAGVTYESGGSKMLVYPSAYAGTNKATYAGWIVDDVEGTVSDLKNKGVLFQTFEMEGMTWDGEIASMGDMKSAWFTDPDGNIFAVGNM